MEPEHSKSCVATLSAMSNNQGDTNTCYRSCVQIPSPAVDAYIIVMKPRFCLQEITSLLSLDVTELLWSLDGIWALAELLYWHFGHPSLLGAGASKHFVRHRRLPGEMQHPSHLWFKHFLEQPKFRSSALAHQAQLEAKGDAAAWVRPERSQLYVWKVLSRMQVFFCIQGNVIAERGSKLVFHENWKRTQSMCIIHICWKIQLWSTNQIAASRKGKHKKNYTMRTK